jgi:hypothetical protein
MVERVVDVLQLTDATLLQRSTPVNQIILAGAEIGRDGGVITLPAVGLTVDFPASAVRTPTMITVSDRNGGELIVGRHRLMVPRNASNRETMLEMTIVDSDLTEFRLSATSVTTSARKGGRRGTVEFALGAENDVGSRGFLRPVELELAFDQAVGADDREQFMVVWVVNPDAPEAEQTLEAMPSRWDKRGLRVTGQLQHVSRYAVGSNRGEDPGMS